MKTFKNTISKGREKLKAGISHVYSNINSSTLTGSIDVIVIEQPDGTFEGGPFHVRFGKIGTLRPAEKIVDIHLNGTFYEHLHMKLDKSGEAYFINSINNTCLWSSSIEKEIKCDKNYTKVAEHSSTHSSAEYYLIMSKSDDEFYRKTLSRDINNCRSGLLELNVKTNSENNNDQVINLVDKNPDNKEFFVLANNMDDFKIPCQQKESSPNEDKKLSSFVNNNVESDNVEKRIITNNDCLKKFCLTSKEIEALNLRPGRNDITFTLSTKCQGTTCTNSAIYLWKWYDRIVISDIDGTITKSDIMGQIMPILGHCWTQINVVKLYNKIYQNNYKFVYLSARAIGQSSSTRTFLQDVVKDSLEKLPDGPILLSPTSLFQSLYREMIEKKPENFKIQCLNDLRSLFHHNSAPLYAGFGNRINDVITYKALDINERKIFTVDHKGSVTNEYDKQCPTTYGQLLDIVDFHFPFHNISDTLKVL